MVRKKSKNQKYDASYYHKKPKANLFLCIITIATTDNCMKWYIGMVNVSRPSFEVVKEGRILNLGLVVLNTILFLATYSIYF